MSSTEAEHHLDADHDAAEDLTNAAKEALVEKPQASGNDGDAHAKASEVIQNVAHIVLDKSNQAADSSEAYIESVVHKVQDHAQNVSSGSTSNLPEALSRAVHIEDGDGSSGSDRGLLTSVATWCSTLCGFKNNAPAAELRSVDVRVAAEDVVEALHSSASTASTSEAPSLHDITPAETPPEAAEPAKPVVASE